LENDKFDFDPFKPYTVDQIKGVHVTPEKGGNELPTLGYLQAGLSDLYQKTKIYEYYLQQYEAASGKGTLQGFGLDFLGLPNNGARLVPCYFHWFGTSIINYARVAGFLGGIATNSFSRDDLETSAGGKKIKDYCDNYLEGIQELDGVRVWRNKIAAHFAITAPKTTGTERDNLALLNLTTMFPIGFSGSRFFVGQTGLSHHDSAGVKHYAQLPRWSLTQVYESLVPRFFSDPQQLPTYVKVPPSQVLSS